MNGRYIPETEFSAYYRDALRRLSEMIVGSGIPIKAIARGTRVKRDTVYAALKGRPIRVDSATRIIYFIKDHQATQAEKTTENSNEENKN